MASEPSSSSRLDTIVLLGSFNPLILDPHWLASNDVITSADLDEALEGGKWFVTRDVTVLRLRKFALDADHDRIQVALTEEAETPLLLADVVVNIFRLLSHTPVRSIGLNHSSHRELENSVAATILDRLAPRATVEDLLPDMRMETLTWSGDRPDDFAGRVRLTVEPSVQVEGLFLNLNDHFDLGDAGTGETAAGLVAEQWQPSLQRAGDVFATLLALQ